MVCLLVVSSLALASVVSVVNGHTKKICYEVNDCDGSVTFYAGSWHSETEGPAPIGGVILSDGPGGNGRYNFTTWVDDADLDKNPDGIDVSELICTECADYVGSNTYHWQIVTVSGLEAGTYSVTTTMDTVIEYPACVMPDLYIDPCPPPPCPTRCNELTNQYGCGGVECTTNCRDCIADIGWDDYSNGQSSNCQCHNNGCDQCADGYWKVFYDYPCTACSDMEGCARCTDFVGCQECEDGYTLAIHECPFSDSYFYHENVQVWQCEPEAEIVCPNYDSTEYASCQLDSHCVDCQSWGCATCEDGYYKMGNFQRCQSCSDNYPNCQACSDWQGCTSCTDGYALLHKTECADEICV